MTLDIFKAFNETLLLNSIMFGHQLFPEIHRKSLTFESDYKWPTIASILNWHCFQCAEIYREFHFFSSGSERQDLLMSFNFAFRNPPTAFCYVSFQTFVNSAKIIELEMVDWRIESQVCLVLSNDGRLKQMWYQNQHWLSMLVGWVTRFSEPSLCSAIVGLPSGGDLEKHQSWGLFIHSSNVCRYLIGRAAADVTMGELKWG